MTDNSSDNNPDYLGHRQRLKERFMAGSGRDMPDYEILEIILMYVIPRRDTKPLAKQLINRFGSLAAVLNAPDYELTEFSGLTFNGVVLLKIILMASVRASWQNLAASTEPILNKMDDMIDYFRSAMCYCDVEEFRMVYLDGKLRIICEEIMQRGTINKVAIHPREVIKVAMSKQAVNLIMVHNHPSGDVTPSKNDIDMTIKILQGCEAVGIHLIDHLIVSKSDYFSFRDSGALTIKSSHR